MTIDPRQLSHLLAIQEHGSLSRAAEALNLSQPALSSSIAILEKRVGAKVLIRSGRGALVNDLGDVLVRRGREMRALLLAAEIEVQLRQCGQLGPLAVGATPTIVEHLLPTSLKLLTQGGENLSVTVIEGLDGPLNDALKAGDLDFIIGAVEQIQTDPELSEEFLFNDPFLLAVDENSPLAQKDIAFLAEAQDQLWVMPRPGGSAYSFVTSLFINANISWPKNCISTNSAILTKHMIIEAEAVAIVNESTLKGWNSAIKGLTISGSNYRKVGIRKRKIGTLSPLARRLIDYIRIVTETDNDAASE